MRNAFCGCWVRILGWLVFAALPHLVLGQEEELVTVQFPNTPIPQILLAYEELTGKNVLQDASVQTASLTIQTTKALPKSQAIRFIEKSLLLNGFALLPSGDNSMKLVAVPTEKGSPRSEGAPIYSELADLPEGDQLVAFILRFEHLGAEDAAKALADIFPSHGYGTIVPFPQASAVVITDSSAVIRRYAELKTHLDVLAPELAISVKRFNLTRADAETVSEAITELLGLDSANANQGDQKNPGDVDIATSLKGAGGEETTVSAKLQRQSPDVQTVQPKIKADTRTNSILAIARPRDLTYIETIITFLDAPASRPNFLIRQLNFVSVSTFLPIAQDALLPGLPQTGTGGGANIQGGDTPVTAQNTAAPLSSGGGSSRGGSSGMGSGSSMAQAEFSQDVGPQSLVVDKTLLIADNLHNTLIASGPDEHLEIIERLLDQMDLRPRQIQISAIIAQVTVGDDLTFGVDVLNTIAQPGRDDNFAGVVRNRPGSIVEIDTLDDVAGFLPAAAGLTLYGRIDGQLNAYLSALQSTNRFHVLARPTIYTLNNKWAAISTGQRIAVPRSTLSTLDPQNVNQAAITSSIDFEEVLLEIQVLPLINSENEVTLQIIQQNDDIIGSQNLNGNDIPTIGTQQLVTTAIVPDGSSILLGGLISEDNRKTTSGLPLFVTLPLVGPLFGNTSNNKSRQELLIFIQPKIVVDDVDLAATQADIHARAESAEEAVSFTTPKLTAEVEKPGLWQRAFGRKFRQAKP